MTPTITCPSCGLVSAFEEIRRDASEFCQKCDYPLFWARGSATIAGGDEGGGTGLRRLPGTSGRIEIGSLECPECDELNALTATVCVRCGADLDPPPPAPEPVPVPPPPPPEPEPEPEVARRIPWWVWAAIAVTAVLIAFVIAVSI